MTGTVRSSAVFGFESKFAEDIRETIDDAEWFRFPPANTFTRTPTSSATALWGLGSKFAETFTYGKFSGTWSASFKMDYQHLEWLRMGFEKYTFSLGTGGVPNKHTFEKVDGKRIPSMRFKIKQINTMVGGNTNETVLIVGAVIKSIKFNQSSGNAPMDITIDGNYVNEYIIPNTDPDFITDYTEYDGDLVEWSCLNIGDTEDTLEPVARTESASISFSFSPSMTPGCGSRFDVNYYENKTNVDVSTTVQSYNPELYMQRVYSGGFKSDSGLPTTPMKKNLKPIPFIALKTSYDKDENTQYSCQWTMKKATVEGYSKSYSDSKLQDSPKIKCSKGTLTVISDAEDLSDIVPTPTNNKTVIKTEEKKE